MRSLIVIAGACLVAACGERTPTLPAAKALSPDGVRHQHPSWSPDGKRVAWWQPRADSAPEWELVVGDADLSNARKLGVYSGNILEASWSPDGKVIAASASNFGFSTLVTVPSGGGPITRVLPQRTTYQIVSRWNRDGDRLSFAEVTEGSTVRSAVVSVSTGKMSALVPGETHPAFGTWSPDGSHIAYQISDGSKSYIWVCDSAGGGKRQLTTEGFETFANLSALDVWSPDGTRVLYESRRTGTSDLWVVPIDGGSPLQLTRDIRNDQNGSWSGDGKWIAFISDRGKQRDVWVVPSAGGPERRVTDTSAEEGEIPRFRPGTLDLTFVESVSAGSVWTHDVATGKETRLTPDSINVSWFNTSLDAKQVNLVIERGGGINDLAVASVTGGPIRTLLAGGGSVQGPLWSPDGSKIVFASDRAGVGDIWVIDATGGAPRALTTWPGSEDSPAWSIDGSTVYFVADREARLLDVWKVPVTGGDPVRVTHKGDVNTMFGRTGAPGFLVSLFGAKGQLSTGVLDRSDVLHTIYDETNSFPVALSPTGDSLFVAVERKDIAKPSMIFGARGGKGRVVLTGNFLSGRFAWSPDGKAILTVSRSQGANHLGVFDLATSKLTQWTSGPDDDGGAEWTADGKTVIFQRNHATRRIYSADLTKELVGK